MTRGWPVTLKHGDVTLRPLRVKDAREWQQLRADNHEWLSEWDATAPLPSLDPPPSFKQSTKRMLKDARDGYSLPFVVEYRGQFVGQLNVADIVYGSLRGCHFGYWISKSVSGLGIMTNAVGMVSDHLFFSMNLHRIEVAIRPENVPSNKLVQRLGFRYEGLRPSFLHINHAWRDHNIYALLREEVVGRVISQAPTIGPRT